jgi:hypothetical protein
MAQRLQSMSRTPRGRARGKLREFVSVDGELASKPARFRRDWRVTAAPRNGRVQPAHLNFAQHLDPNEVAGEMERLHDLASLMRSRPGHPGVPGRAGADGAGEPAAVASRPSPRWPASGGQSANARARPAGIVAGVA